MTDSKALRDALGHKLLTIVTTEDEISPSMVSACVNFLKAFPPAEDPGDLPTAKHLSKSLEQYAASMPFRS
jgi:hypothetical protein